MAPRTTTARGQLTIPSAIREKYHIRPGTPFTVEERDGKIHLEITPEHDPDQAWFWEPEFQAHLKEAEEDIREGRTLGPFDDVEDLIAALHKGWPGDQA